LFPLCAVVTDDNVSVPEVAPEMLVKVVLPAALICHCTVGVGFPLAAAVKLAVCPAVTDWLVGCVLIVGATAGGGGVSVSVAWYMPVSVGGATRGLTASPVR